MSSAKTFLLLCIVSFRLCGYCQTKVVKYYNTDWQDADSAKAEYRATFTKVDNGYDCVSHWLKTKKLYGISTFTDTLFTSPKGLLRFFYQNGNLKDSVLYRENGKIKTAFHFYSNGRLECRYEANQDGLEIRTEGYDEEGKKIRGYTYARPAEPKGGIQGWTKFLLEMVNPSLMADPKKPAMAKVLVRFVVDETGKVVDPVVVESSEIKQVDEDAIQTIQASPLWTPAIYKNKPIRYVMKQPFTYELPRTGNRGK